MLATHTLNVDDVLHIVGMDEIDATFDIISNRVRRLRLQRGWSQKELAKRIGVCQKTVSIIETKGMFGARTLRLEHLVRICQLFGIEMWQLAMPDDDDDTMLMGRARKLFMDYKGCYEKYRKQLEAAAADYRKRSRRAT